MKLFAPPGFRFVPTDRELIEYYLSNWVSGVPISPNILIDCDIYKFEPWRLRDIYRGVGSEEVNGEREMYFFTRKKKKYRGRGTDRTAVGGSWKVTNGDKAINGSEGRVIGLKKSLVFIAAKEKPKFKRVREEKTSNWIMHEYRLYQHRHEEKFEEWVLCRIKESKKCKQNSEELEAQKVQSPKKDINGPEKILKNEAELPSDNGPMDKMTDKIAASLQVSMYPCLDDPFNIAFDDLGSFTDIDEILKWASGDIVIGGSMDSLMGSSTDYSATSNNK